MSKYSHPHEVPITQSLIKELTSYKEGKLCGLQFEAKFIKGMLFPSSPVQQLGQWFEYEATGALPKNKLIPLAESTKKGEPTAPYRLMQKQIENWNRLKERYMIKMISVGRKISVYDKGLVPNPLEGTTDFEAEMTDFRTGKHYPYTLNDIKTTGLMWNKWDDMGWDLDNLSNKFRIILQPIFYKFISIMERGEEPVFHFFLFSNTNETDHRILRFNIDTELHIQLLRVSIQDSFKDLEHGMKNGWIPRPSVKDCANCPLKTSCEHYTDTPFIEIFNLQ